VKIYFDTAYLGKCYWNEPYGTLSGIWRGSPTAATVQRFESPRWPASPIVRFGTAEPLLSTQLCGRTYSSKIPHMHTAASHVKLPAVLVSAGT
jgi:hypothetical protein